MVVFASSGLGLESWQDLVFLVQIEFPEKMNFWLNVYLLKLFRLSWPIVDFSCSVSIFPEVVSFVDLIL